MAEDTTYGFTGRLSEPFPSQVIVDVTERCNLACIHCPHPTFKVSEHYGGRYLDRDLNDKMVEEVRQHGREHTQFIRYTSAGEPFIHPAVYDILEYAVTRAGVPVTVTTNGTIMNEQKVERLLASGIHLVDISIDALTPETYARVRVNGKLEVTRRNVLKLIELKQKSKSATCIVVSFVEQPKNRHETAGFEAYWRSEGADQVVIRRLHSAAGGVESIARDMREAQRNDSRRPCLYPWERIILNPRGDLAFCPEDWVHGSVLASYRETTIRAVWQGEVYRKLREAHLKNDFSCHGFCGQCPDWKQTRWPTQGLSYADMVKELIPE